MVEQVTFQTIISLLTLISLTIGVIYYIMSLRNQNKARQAQLLMNMYNALTASEVADYEFMLRNLEMKGIQDWEKIMDNREQYRAFNFWLVYYEGIGVMVREGYVEIGLVAKLLSGNIIWFWERYGEGIYNLRKELNWPRYSIELEYLHDKVVEYKKRNPDLEIDSPTM
jgi:uncharacterized membrane protein